MKLSLLAILTLSSVSAFAAEVLIHSGPMVSMPISSLSSPERDSEELNFIKQFFIDSKQLAALPPPSKPVPISAERAIELAKKTVDPGGSVRTFSVEKHELLTATVGDSKSIEYYLIEMRVNGSTEHRIVLMDGVVIKSRLKRVASGDKTEKPDL